MRRTAIGAGALLVCALLLVLPHGDPAQTDLANVLVQPSAEHPLGTDHLGRDVWSRLAVGLERTLMVVVVSGAVSLFVGTFLGLVAGWFKGPLRNVIRSFTDLVMIIPSFIAALIIAARFGLNPVSAGLALGFFGIGPFVNQTAAMAQKVLSQDFISAEILLGTSSWKIIFQHLLPGVWPTISAYLGATAGGAVLSYAGLAFIGLGVDSTIPDWGTMIYDYRVYLIDQPLLFAAPIVATALLSTGLHFLLDRESR